MKRLMIIAAVLPLALLAGSVNGQADAKAAPQEPKISVFAHAIENYAREKGLTIAQAAQLFHAAGVRGCDFAYTDTRIGEFLKTTSLKPINMYGWVDFSAADGGRRQADEFIATAVKYRVPRIMIIPIGAKVDRDPASVYARTVRGLGEMAKRARTAGVTPMIEDYGDAGNACSSAKFLKSYLTEIPELSYALDSGNLHYAGRGESILDMMRFAEGRIAHVHLKDFQKGSNRIRATVGLGEIPNAEIVRTVSAKGFDGWYTLEDLCGDSLEDVCRQVSVVRFWCGEATAASSGARTPESAFEREVERVLPVEEPYAFHKALGTMPVHVPRRAAGAKPAADEIAIPDCGWTLVWNPTDGELVRHAILDFQDYLKVSMGIAVEVKAKGEGDGEDERRRDCILVGTKRDMPEFGAALKGPKDYRIAVTPERITVCGCDARGAMYGLFNLEARMNLREAPFLKANLDTVRHSLCDARMAQSWMGWMEFPDALLARMAHDGFDAIYPTPMANPNGDRTTADNSTDFYARILHKVRRQDPARVHDLVNRAAKYGIGVYAPIVYQYMGTPESEAGLRKLVRDIVREFPDIRGYVLLTEGFWYGKWGGQDGTREYLMDWARNWSRGVAIVSEECHRINPAIEILPWEYNINFRPENAEVKRYFIRQLPQDTVPLLTWENGKRLEMDGFSGWVRDYAISQVGPAEVSAAQIAEAHGRKMRAYVNGDTFVCGAQLQTVPYQPFPYQFHARYRAMEAHGVNGTMESWTQGYSPNFMAELRGWYCWSDAPEIDELLGAIAGREFGAENRDAVLGAWKLFSEAIRLVPDTGPYMGTSNAIGNPIFFREPPLRAASFSHSWEDCGSWDSEPTLAGGINPYWPFTYARMVFYPDFTDKTNRAEAYARAVAGVETMKERPFLPTFLKYLRMASDKMAEGNRLYRAAALSSPAEKRRSALREVLVAEQLQRMLESDRAILEFEDLRLKLAAARDAAQAQSVRDRMAAILRDEIARTERALLAATRDSRLGFQQESDYVYTPYSLREKLGSLRETLKSAFERGTLKRVQGFPVSDPVR